MIPQWAHLVFDKNELFEILKISYDNEFASVICEYIYNSQNINRIYADDYRSIFEDTGFEIVEIKQASDIDYDWSCPLDNDIDLMDEIDKRLKNLLSKKSKFLDIRTRDIKVILKKN